MSAPFAITDPVPAGTTLLEASAGTGKTWTIAAIITRLIAEGHHRLDDLLVVTFGRAASQELRTRVRERLQRADALLTHGPGAVPTQGPGAVRTRVPADAGTEHLDAVDTYLLDADTQERRLRSRRIRQALAQVDAATIATIHQFCHIVLDGLGVASDAAAGLTPVESIDDLVAEVIADVYVSGYAQWPDQPPLTLTNATTVAETAVKDPMARLEPADPPPRSEAKHRHAFATAVRAEVERRKERLGVLSYDDLLAHLARSLRSQSARTRLRHRWPIVLVDEFQDTDEMQWQILHDAFHGHSTMVLIGDPKQAIYAFRGGDINTYLRAASVADQHFTLDHNYRSDPPLLSAIQGVFGGSHLGDEEISVSPVQPGRQGCRTSAVPHPEPFRLRIVDPTGMGKNKYGYYLKELRAQINADLAGDIATLLASDAQVAGRSVAASDVAVLVHTHFQADLVQSALAEVNIPAVIAGSGSIFSTDAAEYWLTLLEGMERPGSIVRSRAAALTPFFGYGATDLDTRSDEVTDNVAQRLWDWSQLLRDHGVAAVFETAQGWSEDGVSQRALRRAGGARLLTDLRHVAETLHAEGPDGGVVPLVHWLQEKMAAGDRGEQLRRLDTDASAVQILTIHSSKGLQYPFIYLPTVGEQPSHPDAVPLFHDAAGRRCRDISGSLAPDHRDRARAEAAGEALRLLYVACTRAQSHLILWWMPSDERTPAAPLHRLLFGRDPGQGPVPERAPMPADPWAEARRRWSEHLSIDTSTRVSPPPPPAGDELELGPARSWNRSIDQQWRRTSYTALSAAAEDSEYATLAASDPVQELRADEEDITVDGVAATVAEVPAASAEVPAASADAAAAAQEPGAGVRVPAVLPSPMADLPRGARFGSLVHAVLENLHPAGHGPDVRAAIREGVDEQLQYWPEDLDPAELTDAIHAVVTTPLGPLAPTTLQELPPAEQFRELDFELPLHGGHVPHEAPSPRLADLAPVLRRHVPPGDPLAPYIRELQRPGYQHTSLRGYLTGSIDLVFRVGERYLVADYKTNWLGPEDEPLTTAHYSSQFLNAAMANSSYPLQALLYSVALHRYLRWRLPGYHPATHLGGVLYFYVRGMAGPQTPVVDGHPAGVFSWQPPAGLVTELSDLLDGRQT